MTPPGADEETPAESPDPGTFDGPAGSRDFRRLLVGLLFMAALAGVTLAAAFLVGRPAAGADVATGVPFLAASSAALIVGAAAVFYRTYRGQ